MIGGIAALLAVLISAVGLYFSRKKNKEDVSLATLVQAITSWKDLAESHKTHWDSCEEKYDKLEGKCSKLERDLEELRNIVFVQNLQIQGKMPLDKKE
jgi:hypothetical protein